LPAEIIEIQFKTVVCQFQKQNGQQISTTYEVQLIKVNAEVIYWWKYRKHGSEWQHTNNVVHMCLELWMTTTYSRGLCNASSVVHA